MIHITVNLVQVDAVVMDSKDKPVTDLRKEDFVILQDGKPQVITNFSFINTEEDHVVRTPTAKPAPAAKGAKLPPPPPAIATRPNRSAAPSPWWWTILGLSFERYARVPQSLKRYVTAVQPGDVVSIIRTGSRDGLAATVHQQQAVALRGHRPREVQLIRTRRRRQHRAASGIDSQNTIETANFDNERAQIFSAGTLGAIQYVVEGLRELPGRKSVVLFSENLKLMYGGEQSQRVQDSIRRLGDAANRASVVIL